MHMAWWLENIYTDNYIFTIKNNLYNKIYIF